MEKREKGVPALCPVFELLKDEWKEYGLLVVRGDMLAEKLIVPL